jgi:phosphatidylserine decarboxylase
MTEALNFLFTNRLPRIALSRFMGWFSRLEVPLLTPLSLLAWRSFADLHLEEAAKARFTSIHDCFTRELKPGARPFDADPAVLASPCDAIVGASGKVEAGRAFQIKGAPYSLEELMPGQDTKSFAGGTYVTLRITSTMYHRFHAPHDCSIGTVTRISGDAWNVNPPALKRVEKLFCKNSRAIVPIELEASGHSLLLVPVAAILVGGIRIHGDARFAKGAEMGWFEHGSTILVFTPPGFSLLAKENTVIRAGEPLMRLPSS